MPRLRRHSGFSLLETLSVLAVAAVLIGVAARSSLPSRDHQATRLAAEDFQALLRQARQLALDHRAPARVVFIPRSLSTGEAPGEDGSDPWFECALFRFVIPDAGDRTVTWRAPAAENSTRGGDALERIPVAPPGLPAELVGQWQRVSHKPLRFGHLLDRSLRVQSELLERFARQSPEEFAAENAHRPLAYWEAGAHGRWDGFCQTSPFPANYHRTPWPHGPQLRHEPLPSSARLFDPQAGRWQPASAYWPPDQPVPHFRAEEVEALAFHDLPFLEFDAQGRLQIRWEGSRDLVFELEDRPEFHVRVAFGGADHQPRVAALAR